VLDELWSKWIALNGDHMDAVIDWRRGVNHVGECKRAPGGAAHGGRESVGRQWLDSEAAQAKS
jgi:hypothetical protein